jgi:hypothetical protein
MVGNKLYMNNDYFLLASHTHYLHIDHYWGVVTMIGLYVALVVLIVYCSKFMFMGRGRKNINIKF